MSDDMKIVPEKPYAFEAMQSSDDLKTDLELTCATCGKVLCDIENGDLLGTLMSVCKAHEDECPGPGDD